MGREVLLFLLLWRVEPALGSPVEDAEVAGVDAELAAAATVIALVLAVRHAAADVDGGALGGAGHGALLVVASEVDGDVLGVAAVLASVDVDGEGEAGAFAAAVLAGALVRLPG